MTSKCSSSVAVWTLTVSSNSCVAWKSGVLNSQKRSFSTSIPKLQATTLPTPLGVQPDGSKERFSAEMETDGCSIALGPSAFHHLIKSRAGGDAPLSCWSSPDKSSCRKLRIDPSTFQQADYTSSWPAAQKPTSGSFSGSHFREADLTSGWQPICKHYGVYGG